MIRKYKISIAVFLSVVLVCFFSVLLPIKKIYADDTFNNDTIVTFGIYSSETGQIEISEPLYFFDHIRYGMANGIYNYYKRTYGDNANFPSNVSIFSQRLLDYFGTDFFQNLSSSRWLLNIYTDGRYNDIIWLCFNRVPGIRSYPSFEKRYNLNEKYTIELLPDTFGTSYYVFSNNGITSYCPYYYNDNIPIDDTSSLYVSSSYHTKFTSLEELKTAISNLNIRSFCIRLSVNVPALTFSAPFTYMYYNAYYDSVTLKAFTEINNYGWGGVVPIMTDFPVFSYNGIFAEGTTSSYTYTKFFYNNMPNALNLNQSLSPILISGYEEIPNATPTPTWTPTPIPTWTPYPTPTPFPPVNEIEGISQMMTLFTRKYEFNINGNVIGIRPLYLFVFTFLVGAIFKAIQGGDRN